MPKLSSKYVGLLALLAALWACGEITPQPDPVQPTPVPPSTPPPVAAATPLTDIPPNTAPPPEIVTLGETTEPLPPTATPPALPLSETPVTPVANIKPELLEELFFTGAGGGFSCDGPVYLEPNHPEISFGTNIINQFTFCFFDFPINEQVRIQLFAPDGVELASGEFFVSGAQVFWIRADGSFEDVGFFCRKDEVCAGSKDFFTVVDIPRRSNASRIVASSQTAYAELQFEVNPWIATWSGGASNSMDLFRLDVAPCATVSAQSDLVITGGGFEPNAKVPLGIYAWVEHYEPFGARVHYDVWDLVYSQMAEADEWGQLNLTTKFNPARQASAYTVIAVLDAVSEKLGSAGPNDCIEVADSLVGPPITLIGQHRVVRGETLFCIGRAYGVLPSAIEQVNNIPNPDSLEVGQVLKIPEAPWPTIPAGPACPRQFDSPFIGESSTPVP